MNYLPSVVATIFAVVIGTLGYLIKRSIFREIDELRDNLKTLRTKDLEDLQDELRRAKANMEKEVDKKIGMEWCIQMHKTINGSLEEIKEALKEGTKDISSMKTDIAVIKATVGVNGTKP